MPIASRLNAYTAVAPTLIGKQHFTLLYNRARCKAFSSRNITSAWSKSGLRLFNPQRVLKDIHKLEVLVDHVNIETEKRYFDTAETQQLVTPTTSEGLMSLHRQIDDSIAQCSELDDPCKIYVQKLANATENAFADQAILLDENLLLFEQNNEKATRKSIKATVVGSARVMSYEDIVEAQKQRDIKDAATVTRSQQSKRNPTAQVLGKRSRGQALEDAEHEIRASRMAGYCSVLDFK